MPYIRLRSWCLLIAGSAVVLGLTGCGGADGATAAQQSPTPESPRAVSGQITVFAASSLTDAFNEIKSNFEKANPGTTVVYNFSGSSTLATQIERGAPVEVFASAEQPQMDRVVNADPNAGKPTVFAQNKLEIVVPRGNPGNVTSLADFSRPELKIAICAPEVPCGAARGNTVDLADGGTLITAEPATGPVLLAFEPNAVSMHRTQPNGSLHNTWPVHVDDLEERGSATRVRLSGHPDVLADIAPDVAADLDLTPGTSLWAGLKATAIRSYPKQPEK